MKKTITLTAVIFMMIATVCLAASSTQMINYQGRLIDTDGATINGSTVSVNDGILY